MKMLLLILPLVGLLCSPVLADAPQIPIAKAISIAERAINERKLDVYIQSAALERASFTSSESYWIIKWDHPVPAINPRNREIGMKIRMDGSSVRLVKEPGSL